MSLDDVPLDRAPLAPDVVPPPEAPSPARWIVVGASAVLAGALLTFWWMSRAQPVPAAPPSATARDVAAASSRPKRQPIDLPSLNESDSLLRSLVGTLSRNPTLARLLATPGLVRGLTLSLVQIGDGRTPVQPLRVLRPTQRLQIEGAGPGRIDPQTYARWDAAAGALTSVDPAEAAQLYVNIKPLLDEAYIELGSPDGDIDASITRAIRTLAATPAVSEDVILIKRPGYFEYDDPALRALQPVQKQFLLLGADNRKRVIAWLRQFAGKLDLKVE
ncbi:MAG: DUF3014 domain-containing protein [Vicinamibacterales bacterium]